MELEQFFGMSYKGSKHFTQQEIPAANATGFGAAADDYMERGVDLNEQLVRNKPATFFMRVNSSAMKNAGIFQGDVVIIDRSLNPVNGTVIIASLNGELLIRRLEKTMNKVRLLPETTELSPIEVNACSEGFSVWGVVTYVIHKP